MDTRVSADFSKTLTKCISWISANRDFIDRTMLRSSFMNSLAQQCIIRKDVDPLKIIEFFQCQGIVAEDSVSGLLEYHLPMQRMKVCHYMASTEDDDSGMESM
jgi:hypothetical protein